VLWLSGATYYFTVYQSIFLIFSDFKMHPLPPPPNRTSANQTAPSRPSVAPIQENPANAEQSHQSVPQANAETKKKRKHRGKKSKRNRRQSFAAPSEGSSVPSAIPDIMAEQTGADRSNSGLRQPFYRLGQSGRNLSSTSLESEALFDHRWVTINCALDAEFWMFTDRYDLEINR
jgi:magnesium transporter